MKIGFASLDFSPNVKDENGHPIWGGSGWARLGQYVDLLPFDVVAGAPAFQNGVFGVHDWEQNHFDCDIIYMQRAMFGDIPERMIEARKNGQIIINDIDDWYWGLSSANQAFLASHPKHNEVENTHHYKKALASSDVVTVSTPYLADRISNFVKCPIVLVRNHIDVNRFIVREVSDSWTPIVGWVGSTAHRSNDLETMKGILGPLAQDDKISLHHSGFHPNHPLFADGIGVEKSLVSTLPMKAPQDYPELFQFDIGVVPLSSTPFNEAKSYIKGLEYAASGIPFVASNSSEYKYLSEKGLGFCAKRPANWINHLNALRDPSVRKELSCQYLETVKDFDISVGVALLTNFFHTIKP